MVPLCGRFEQTYGGLSKKSTFLSDAVLKLMKWKTVKIHEKDLLPFTPQQCTQQTNFPYLYAVVQRAKTQEYMCLVEANSLAHKELYLCHIGQKPLTWVRLCSPPFPLPAHSAFLDLLVAFGGQSQCDTPQRSDQ